MVSCHLNAAWFPAGSGTPLTRNLFVPISRLEGQVHGAGRLRSQWLRYLAAVQPPLLVEPVVSHSSRKFCPLTCRFSWHWLAVEDRSNGCPSFLLLERFARELADAGDTSTLARIVEARKGGANGSLWPYGLDSDGTPDAPWSLQKVMRFGVAQIGTMGHLGRRRGTGSGDPRGHGWGHFNLAGRRVSRLSALDAVSPAGTSAV